MQRESHRYDGAPVSFVEKVRRWLTPTGGRVIDGLRLAVINVAVLALAFALIGLIRVIHRTVGALVPGSLLLPGFFIVLLAAGACLAVCWRYAEAHARTARGSSIEPDAGVFGVVAGLPFSLLALLLLGSGLFGILLAIITLSSGRFVHAIERIGYGLLFGALAAGVVLVARLATD